MSLIPNRDNDGDIGIGSISVNTNDVRLTIPSLTIDNEGSMYFRENISYRTLEDDLREQIYSNRRFSNARNNSLSEDLVFLDMKVENLDNVYKTIITFIDKKSYQEVKMEYSCNISFERELSIRDDSQLKIEIEQLGDITQTRKDI